MKKFTILFIAGIFAFIIQTNYIHADSEIPAIPEVPVKGMVTMLDLGAKKCIPCKMMAPILVELEKEYKDKAAIVFIDVWQKENQEYVKRFKIRSIPTQIFFDKDGREISRHVGFLDKQSIMSTLKKLGVSQPVATDNKKVSNKS